MKVTMNGSRIARWRAQEVAGYTCTWVEWPDGRTSYWARITLPSGHLLHLTAAGPVGMATSGCTIADLYAAAEAYVAIVSEVFGWRS